MPFAVDKGVILNSLLEVLDDQRNKKSRAARLAVYVDKTGEEIPDK